MKNILKSFMFICLLFCSEQILAGGAPVNDNCAGATALTVGASCSYTSGTDNNATTEAANPSICAGTEDDDVWYKFQATATTATISVDGSTSFDAVIELLSGTCGSLTSITCKDATSSDGIETISATGLTVGTWYYVRVYDYWSGMPATTTFDICVYNPTPPANNECTGAIALTVNPNQLCGTVTPGTITAATASAQANGCGGTADDDVWYKFVATSTSHTVDLLNVAGSTTDLYHSVYAGTCAAPGAALICSDPNNSAIGGLTIGNTYYVRVYSWTSTSGQTSTFNICIGVPPPPPANDECAGAVSLIPGAACVATAGNILNATQSMPGCLGTANDDVWYSFVAANTSQNITVTPSASFDPVVQVFSGTCASLTSLSCNDATFLTGTTGTMNVTGLTVGQTYYYRIYDYYSGVPATTTFTTCITNPGVPNNQDCLGAIPICNSTYSTAIAYSGTGNILNEIDPIPSCLGAGEKNDVWYVFTVLSSGNLNFTIDPVTNADDYDWAVYNLTTANCTDIFSNSALEVSCNFSGSTTVYNNAACTGTTPSEQGNTGPNGYFTACNVLNEDVVPVLAGQTYVVNVSQYSVSQDGYTIDFSASTASIFDNVAPSFQSVDLPIPCGATQVTFHFSENVRCNTVTTADFVLTGPGGPYTITGIISPQCAAGATYGSDYTITVNPPIMTSGNYTISLVTTAGSVSDICNNTAPARSFNFTITGVTATTAQTNPTCGGTNGVASINPPSGGTSPYTYLWNTVPAQTTATIIGLAAGIYICTVTDALGCGTIKTITLTAPTAMTLVVTPTPVCGATLGSIFADVTNGTPNYTYTGGPSAANNKPGDWTFTNVSAGTYNITVTDAGGCTATATAIVTNNTPSSTFTYDGNHCVGIPFAFTNTGSSGAGYTYSWTFPSGIPASSTTNNQAGVTWAVAGTYTVTHVVTQTASGCASTTTQGITVFANPTATATKVDPTCYGSCNGTATAGGGGTYSWSTTPAQTSAIATGLCAGSYTVTVTNANG
ncbi:MAG: hypothetical protein WC599_09185, partial [Bacteroidales bacterium]